MPIGFSLEASKDQIGKRFLWIAPDLALVAKHLKEHGALGDLKSKWNSTWHMINAHKPECTVIFIPDMAAADFEPLVLIEELLDVNIQILDSLELLDDASFKRHAPKRTAYVSMQISCSAVLEDEKWVCLNDVDCSAYEELIGLQSGLLLMEDVMTGILILSKKLERTIMPLGRRVKLHDPEVVIVVGLNATDMIPSISKLCENEKVTAIISCEAAIENITPSTVPYVDISDTLDTLGIDLMWREIKKHRHNSHTYVFLGEWSFDKTDAKKHLEHFSKLEKTVPSSSCVFDTAAWVSLHPKTKPSAEVRIMLNPATTFKHFMSTDAATVEIKIAGANGGAAGEGSDNECGCDCVS